MPALTTLSAPVRCCLAHLRGASDRAIAHQTRHRSLAPLGAHVRVHEAWTDLAATQLGL